MIVELTRVIGATICSRPIRVGIATGNPVKLRAVERAFTPLCNIESIIRVDPPEGLPPQPAGALEVARGALARAVAAWEEADMGVGVEAGPVEFYSGSGFIELQVAVIVGPGERVSVGLSPGFELPRGLLEPVLRGVELGSLLRVRKGDVGEGIGYVGLLTSGRVTRQDLTVLGIIMALLPWANGYYEELPTLEEYRRMIEVARAG